MGIYKNSSPTLRTKSRCQSAALAALAGIAGLAVAHSAVAGHGLDRAQDTATNSLTVDVGDCVNLKSRRARFACYEKHVDAAQRERGAAGQVAQAASSRADLKPAEAAAPSAARRDAQASVAPLRERAAAATPAEAEKATPKARVADQSVAAEKPQTKDASEIISTITALRPTVPNSYLITLANGQIWRQMRPERYELRVGQRVRLYSTPRWGSAYRLTVEKLKGFIQVERVR